MVSDHRRFRLLAAGGHGGRLLRRGLGGEQMSSAHYSDDSSGRELQSYTNEWREHMRSCLGKNVAVLLDKEQEVYVRGKLLMFDEGGEVCVIGEDGFRSWAWPNLETKIQE